MLPVQAGPVTHQVLFLVDEALQLHSRPDLAALDEGRPSTYHQIVSYLTNAGQVDLLSSQLVAQQCYQLSIQEQKGEKSSDSLPLEDHTPS